MSIFRKKVREFVPNTAGSDRESGFHYRLAPEGVFQQELYDALRRTCLLSTLASAR